jgi:hypothetical protein
MALTFTYEREVGGIARVIAAWTSDGSGDASGTTGVRVCGRLVKAVTDPGSAAPTDNYDVTITDDEGVNVLTACQTGLGNRDAATSEETYFLVLDAAGTPLAQSVHPVVCSTLTFAVANAGASKTGQIILYVQGALDGAF